MIRNIVVNYIQRIWYELNFLHIITGYKFYFRRWQVANHPRMKRKEAVIYVANHQNAFLDALSIIMSQRRHPIFLTRANIFAKPIARFMLRSYNMIPIYRSRDGVDTLSKNEKIIEECKDILIDGRQPLAIFVEGNHSMKRSLRPLKKGAARIALSALEKADFSSSLKIIPVGVNYSKHTGFRSDLLVNWGEPILVNDYKDLFEENPNKAFNSLTNRIDEVLRPLIVDISDKENYQEIEDAWIARRELKDNMLEELHNDQQIVNELIATKAAGQEIEPLLPKKQPNSLLKMILGFPAFIYGTLNHLPIMMLMQRLTGKLVTDVHFLGSIKLVGGMYLGMVLYFLQATGVYALTGGNLIITLFYLMSLPFFGIFAYDHYLKYYTTQPSASSSARLLKNK